MQNSQTVTTNNDIEIKSLSEITDFALGGDWGKSPDFNSTEWTKVRVIRGKEFSHWDQTRATTSELRKIKQSSLEKRQLRSGDLIIEVSGGGPTQPVGRVIIIGEEDITNSDLPLVCSNFFRLLRLKDDVDPLFVKLALDYVYQTGEVTKYQTSSTNLRNLRFTDYLEKVEVPLPSKKQQEQVSQKISELGVSSQKAKLSILQAKKYIQKFRQSVLSAAVTGKLTEEWREKNGITQEWEERKLRDLVIKRGIFDGPFGSHLKTSDYTDSGVRVIRLENVGFLNFIEDKKTYVSQEKYIELSNHEVREGDIIFASFISDGTRVVVLPHLETKAIAKADCFCIRVQEEILNKDYLSYALSSSQLAQQLTAKIHGVTRPRINTTQLKEALIPLPTLKEQIEIVKKVKNMFSLAGSIEAQIQVGERKAEKLTQSILAKAFRGEL